MLNKYLPKWKLKRLSLGSKGRIANENMETRCIAKLITYFGLLEKTIKGPYF